ncbi:unnamed protein product, partial [marine sediment metagenome]
TGGCVYMKEGTYNINDSIVIANNNISIIGCGPSTIIQTATNITMIDASGSDNILTEKIQIIGAGVLANLNYGIYIYNSDNSIVRNCWISGCGNFVIRVSSSDDVLVEGNNIKNNWSSGIVWTNASLRGIVINNLCSSNANQGIDLSSGCDYSIITGNQCNLSSNSEGVALTESDFCIITNNECNNNLTHGINLTNCDKCDVEGNICDDNNRGNISYNGINIDYTSDGNTIVGNICTTSRANGSGISIDNDSNENIISSNECSGNGTWGIKIVNANCDKNLVTGNICLNNTTGAIQDLGTNT